MYKEPFLLPTENLTEGLGDTRKLSVSNGLEGTEGQGVTARDRGRWRPREARASPRVPGQAQGLQIHVPNLSRTVPQTTTTLRALSQAARGRDWPPHT